MEMATSILQLGDWELFLWLHSKKNPEPEEWDLHLGKLRDAKDRRGGDLSKFRSLVMSDGGAPGSRERHIIFKELLDGKDQRFAAISAMLSNPVLRGIGTAISWMRPSFKVYAPDQIRQALSYLQFSEHAAKIIDGFGELQALLPHPSETLRVSRTKLGLLSDEARA